MQPINGIKQNHFYLYPKNKNKGNVNRIGPRPMDTTKEIELFCQF